jgi:phage-related protein
MAAGGIEVARAYVTIIPSLEGSQKTISQELGAAVDKEGDKAGKSLGQKLLSGTGSVLKTGGKILGGLAITAATTAVAGVTAITKQALSSFKDYEQLSGGVEKLFGDTASTVMANASKAFATAGLDANQYMEQVTSVSASLIQSLSGDTEAAAKYADMAISDMADNANVFGSDIQSIQNAYSGFAKGNYGMLDNLKLGYQGTKDEMQRLLDDAEKLSGVHYELGNYADMVDAIHVIQTEMNITGTTAKEALGTIEGSMNMAKSAWSNFATALAGGGDITEALDGLKTAIFGVEGASNGLVNNVLPVIERTVNSIMEVFPDIISSLLPTVISTIQGIIPKLVDLTTSIIPVLTDAIDQLFGDGFDTLLNDVVSSIPKLITALLNAIPTILKAITKIITSVLNAIVTNLPSILKAIVDAIPGIISSLLESLTTIVEAIVDAIPDVLMAIIEALGAIVEMLPDLIMMIVEALPDLLVYIIEGILGNLPMILEGLVNLVLGIVAAIPQIIISLVEAIPTIIEQVLTAVISCLPQIITAIVQLVFMIIQELPTILMSLWDAVIACFDMLYTQLPQTIMNLLPLIITAIGDILTSVWNTLVDFFTNLGDWFFNTEMGQFLVNLATVFVMLYDEVKNFLHDLFEPFTSFMSDLFGKLKDWFTEVFNKIKEVFTNIFNTVKEKLTNIFNKVKEVFTNIYNAIKTPIDNAKTTVTNVINTMKSTITSVFNSIYSTVQNIFNKIKSAITGPIDTAKSLVSNAISAMRNIINNAGFSLPHIKLPHFSITGSFSLSPPSTPHLSVDWYGKAYDEAQILKGATIFGLGANGDVLAGGERGNEIVVGEEHLIDLLRDNVGAGNITVNVYGAPGQDEDALARIVIDKIQDITNSKEVVYA